MSVAVARSIRAAPPLYGGLFFTTLSTLMYEILLTRIFSVTMWYHFAFVAVSVALFGLTAGALIVHLLPRLFPDDRVPERITLASLLFGVTIVLSFMTQLSLPFEPRWTLIGVYSVTLIYVVIAVPFVFSGIVVCLALTRFSRQVSSLYAVDLIGAGLGTVTLIWVLNLLEDAPSTVFAVAALAAAGTFIFAFSFASNRMRFVSGLLAVSFAAMAIGNAFAADAQNPIVRVRYVKGGTEDVPLLQKWNSFSRVAVFGDPTALTVPMSWGRSKNYPAEPSVQQLTVAIDSAALTVFTGWDGDRDDLEHLRFDVTNFVHYLRSNSDVFIVGSGGGRDVLTSLYFDQNSIRAVELNPQILEMLNIEYGEFTGHLDQQPGVTFVNDEARSYLARSSDRFDIIQLSLIDTFAATSAGAFALSENSLYTLDAWEMFIEHLTPNGVLSVSRWYLRSQPLESYRLTSLAAASLRASGVRDPGDNLILVASQDSFVGPAVMTALVAREPFTPEDVTQVEEVANDLGFDILLAPGHSGPDPIFGRIVEADDPTDVALGFPGDISAPTDNRPFFFQMVRFQDVFNRSLYGGFHEELVTKGVLVLFSLAVAVLGLTAVCLVLPLVITTSREAIRGMVPFIVFFSGIGMGFLLLEIAQMQRLIIFLGHPTYALSVVLFALLVFSGLGSLATERFVNLGRGMRPSPSVLAPFALLLFIILAAGIFTPQIIDEFDAETNAIRILVSVALLAPMGFVMGMPFPVGMKIASLRPGAPTAFFWGINGATSVCASVFAVVISMGWGISNAFWVGTVCYLAATLAMSFVVLRGQD